jgi:hypothetical protein
MSYTDTFSEANTFTVTHARHMAAKVSTDLKRMQRFYGEPSNINIAKYEEEITLLLRDGYLGEVSYGFRRNGEFIAPTLRFTARDLSGSSCDDNDPGGIRPGADISNASFYSYLIYSSAWNSLSFGEQEDYKKKLPFPRSDATRPSVNGYFSNDKVYSSGGIALDRSIVRSF